jgi:hypothetical protein
MTLSIESRLPEPMKTEGFGSVDLTIFLKGYR